MELGFLPEANCESIDADNIVTFQKHQEATEENSIMADIIHPEIPYKGIAQAYITQSSRFIDDSNEIQSKAINQHSDKKKKKVKIRKKKIKKNIVKNDPNRNNNFVDSNDINKNIPFPSDFSNQYEKKMEDDICPNTPNEMPISDVKNPDLTSLDPNFSNGESENVHYIKKFDASNPNHIFSSLSIGNNEKLKKEINDNLRVQRIKEKRKKEEEFRIQKFEEDEIKVKARLSALQQQQQQKIVKNHEYYRAKSQKALEKRQILEEIKLKAAKSAMIRMETAEKRKLQIEQAKHEAAVQKAAGEWLKRHFAHQAILQMERRKQRQMKLLVQKENELTVRIQKMKSDLMKKGQTRRIVMKKYLASVPT